MLERGGLYGLWMRRLAVLALVSVPLAAGAAEADPRLVDNPALGRVAAADPAKAERLLDAIDWVLRQPAAPRMRASSGFAPADEVLLADNPLLGQLYSHDPAAAVELLKRIKSAGGR